MGIFITRGMTVAIPTGGLNISRGKDGGLTGSLDLHVRFDVCPSWIELSIQHLEEARRKRSAREVAWNGTDDIQKAVALEQEFESSMQAIVCGAIAVDAFYAVVQTYSHLPTELIEKWREKRTSRYSQIAEVMRRAFKLKKNSTAVLRQNIKEIYRLRDLAVHPSGKIEAPMWHPELRLGVEWRFAYFRTQNAELIVNTATGLIWTLALEGQPENSELKKYIAGLSTRLIEIFPSGHPTSPTKAISKE